jgi:predicted DNA-binding transcriptional regulator YafY
MDLLTELGFEVGKDDHNKFFLKADQIVEPFTKEESHLIQEVLTVSVKNNPLVASIKAKLPSLEESNILANNIVNGHLSKLVSQINESILNKTQINILKYQSASSESITDRLVEPIGFTSNYQYLCAFEVESQQNKYFKLESFITLKEKLD